MRLLCDCLVQRTPRTAGHGAVSGVSNNAARGVVAYFVCNSQCPPLFTWNPLSLHLSLTVQHCAAAVAYWRVAAVNALDHFEKAQKSQLGLHTFAKMASVMDPKFLEPLMTVMSAEKPNLSKVAVAMSAAARRQWYCWHVMCPDSPVHDERSMHLYQHA